MYDAIESSSQRRRLCITGWFEFCPSLKACYFALHANRRIRSPIFSPTYTKSSDAPVSRLGSVVLERVVAQGAAPLDINLKDHTSDRPLRIDPLMRNPRGDMRMLDNLVQVFETMRSQRILKLVFTCADRYDGETCSSPVQLLDMRFFWRLLR